MNCPLPQLVPKRSIHSVPGPSKGAHLLHFSQCPTLIWVRNSQYFNQKRTPVDRASPRSIHCIEKPPPVFKIEIKCRVGKSTWSCAVPPLSALGALLSCELEFFARSFGRKTIRTELAFVHCMALCEFPCAFWSWVGIVLGMFKYASPSESSSFKVYGPPKVPL
jgi:hypothetical protein